MSGVFSSFSFIQKVNHILYYILKLRHNLFYTLNSLLNVTPEQAKKTLNNKNCSGFLFFHDNVSEKVELLKSCYFILFFFNLEDISNRFVLK